MVPFPDPAASDPELERSRRAWHDQADERRRHQRYPLDSPLTGELLLDSAIDPPIPVDVADVSAGGVCLLISSLFLLQRGQVGTLHTREGWHDAAGDLSRRRVRVCWSEPRDRLAAVGVAFDDLDLSQERKAG